MLSNIYSDNFIFIKTDTQDSVLLVTWIGRQTKESVIDGCTRIHSAMQDLQRFEILNDNRHVIGDWSEASNWVSAIWFPLMIKAKMTKFAWIKGSLDLTKASIDKTIETLDLSMFPVRVFNDYDQGHAWLKEKP